MLRVDALALWEKHLKQPKCVGASFPVAPDRGGLPLPLVRRMGRHQNRYRILPGGRAKRKQHCHRVRHPAIGNDPGARREEYRNDRKSTGPGHRRGIPSENRVASRAASVSRFAPKRSPPRVCCNSPRAASSPNRDQTPASTAHNSSRGYWWRKNLR